MARVDGEPTGLQLAAVDLVDVARQEIERARVRAPAASLTLEGATKALVHGNHQRLAQILGNLLDNAVRAAGPTGRVGISVQASHSDQPQHSPGGDPAGTTTHWCVDVRDNGPGIPDGERERIFDRLVRLDASRTRDTGGSGLGLPIARALARAHGGSLDCLPDADGAHFRLVLPAA